MNIGTYEQSSGNIFDPSGAMLGVCYAGGNCGNNPEGVNDPQYQTVHQIGPLPVGLYTLGTPEDSPKLGPFAIPLIPDPANIMFGRSGFYCHGDNAQMNQSASEGCIVADRAIREVVATWDAIKVV